MWLSLKHIHAIVFNLCSVSPIIEPSKDCCSTSWYHISVAHTSYISSNSWIIDSGATSHIAHSLHLFMSHKPLSNYYVSLPNGLSVSVPNIGSVALSSNLLIGIVLYVPDFKVNLLLVPTLLSTSPYTFTFSPTEFFIQESSTSKVIGKSSLFLVCHL